MIYWSIESFVHCDGEGCTKAFAAVTAEPHMLRAEIAVRTAIDQGGWTISGEKQYCPDCSDTKRSES